MNYGFSSVCWQFQKVEKNHFRLDQNQFFFEIFSNSGSQKNFCLRSNLMFCFDKVEMFRVDVDIFEHFFKHKIKESCDWT